MWIKLLLVLLAVVAAMLAPKIVWGDVERSLDDRDDEVCDRDRSKECRDMARRMETTKHTKVTK